MNKDACLKDIEALWKRFYTVRGAMPYLRAEDVGATETRPRPFYEAKEVFLTLKFDKPLTEKDIVGYNGMSYWVNQSFVIWLCALLEYHRVIGKKIPIMKDLPGSQDVDILRRLRNCFAHTNGRYNRAKDEERKLFEAMDRKYAPMPLDNARFNLHIDVVLQPMVNGVKEYVSARQSLA